MKNFIKTGHVFYGTGIAGIGIQQFFYSDFRPVLIPQWFHFIPGVAVLAYVSGACLVIAGAIIACSKNAKIIAFNIGLAFLLLFLAFHVTYQLFVNPYGFSIGLWSDPLKELALSGGAFVIAGSYPVKSFVVKTSFSKAMEKCLPAGKIFFSITMIVFGIDHFIYPQFVATLVPSWIPGNVFWVYFAGMALIGAGVAIIINFKRKLIALLLAIMLFAWLIILHIPRTIADFYGNKGNELTSVFEALAFSGIAFIISSMDKRK